MHLLVDSPMVDIATESRSDGNHRLRPIDNITWLAHNVDNSDVMDLVNVDNEVMVVDDEDVMVADVKRCLASPVANLMRMLIHQR